MSERRRTPRIAWSQRCWCEGDDLTLYAQMGNLGEGGAFVRTHAPLPNGSRTRVRFRADGHAIETDATVVWRSDGSIPGLSAGMGLRFDGLSEASRAALRRLLGMLPGDGETE